MIAMGKPRAAETIVVAPGAPRTSTSPPANAPMAAAPAAITTRFTLRPYFSNRPASLAIHKGSRLPVTDAYETLSVSSCWAEALLEKQNDMRVMPTRNARFTERHGCWWAARDSSLHRN